MIHQPIVKIAPMVDILQQMVQTALPVLPERLETLHVLLALTVFLALTPRPLLTSIATYVLVVNTRLLWVRYLVPFALMESILQQLQQIITILRMIATYVSLVNSQRALHRFVPRACKGRTQTCKVHQHV